MALFSRKKNKSEKEVSVGKPVDKTKNSGLVPVGVSGLASRMSGAEDTVRTILIRPRVTEKVTLLTGTRNVYTFEIGRSATKKSVSEVVQKLYKVTPVKIRILPIQRKRVFVRGKVGFKGGGRKAYIYLKSGDKMDTA